MSLDIPFMSAFTESPEDSLLRTSVTLFDSTGRQKARRPWHKRHGKRGYGCVVKLSRSKESPSLVDHAVYRRVQIFCSLGKNYTTALRVMSTICPFIKLIHPSLHCNPAHLSWPRERRAKSRPRGCALQPERWGPETVSQEKPHRAAASSISDVMSAQMCVVTVPVTAHCERKAKTWVALSAAVSLI